MERDEEVEREHGRHSPVDGRYGWLVCASAAFVMFAGVGTLMCYGVLYVELLAYFGEGRTKTSWIGAFCFLSLAVAGPVSASLSNHFSHRLTMMVGAVLASIALLISAFASSIYYLFVSFGLLGGIGMGCTWIPSIAMVAIYFDKKRSLAIGVATSSGGLAFLIFPFMMDALIKALSWRGTMLVLASIWMQCVVCGALMRPIEAKKGQLLLHKKKVKKQKEEAAKKRFFQNCDVSIFKMWQFWAYILLEYLMRVDFLTFPTILPDFATLGGYEMKRATLLLTIYGAVSIPVRWIAGFVADRPNVNAVLFLSLSTAAQAILSLAFPFIGGHYAVMGVLSGLKGAAAGCFEVIQPAVLVVLFGKSRVTTTLGYDMVAINMGQLTSAPLAGVIYDQFGSYMYSFLTCSILGIVAAFLAFGIFIRDELVRVKRGDR